MSVKIMGMVWDCALPRAEKFVLLAYADHADHEGNNIYPSYERIAFKTGYDRRQVMRITGNLSQKKVLVSYGVSPWGTNLWRIDVSRLPKHPERAGGPGDKMSLAVVEAPGEAPGDVLPPPEVGDSGEMGDKMVPVEDTPGAKTPASGGLTAGSDILSPPSDILTPAGDILTPGGDILSEKTSKMSPKPSFNRPLNRQEESRARGAEADDSFDQMLKTVERLLGYPSTPKDIPAIQEMVALKITEADLRDALAWFQSAKKTAFGAAGILGAAKHARASRIQKENALPGNNPPGNHLPGNGNNRARSNFERNMAVLDRMERELNGL